CIVIPYTFSQGIKTVTVQLATSFSLLQPQRKRHGVYTTESPQLRHVAGISSGPTVSVLSDIGSVGFDSTGRRPVESSHLLSFVFVFSEEEFESTSASPVSSLYISSTMGFQRRTRAFMNQLETY
ncbi:ryanodine receptor 1, partial [Striga asiatica]